MNDTVRTQCYRNRRRRLTPGLWVTGFILLALAVAGASSVFAASSSTNTFTNNTGAAVDDLHIDYNTAVQVTQTLPAPFGSEEGEGSSSIDLTGGTVAAGGTVQIKADGDANKTRVKKWYWTRGEVQVGKTHNGCKAPDCSSP